MNSTTGNITTLNSTTGNIKTLAGENANLSGRLTAGSVFANGNSVGGTHFPWPADGNNYITSNNNILRGGPTTVQGDLNVSGTITKPDTFHYGWWFGGWDYPDKYEFQVNGIQDCINQCKKLPEALSCSFRNDNRCYCKTVKGIGGRQGNHTMILFGDR